LPSDVESRRDDDLETATTKQATTAPRIPSMNRTLIERPRPTLPAPAAVLHMAH